MAQAPGAPTAHDDVFSPTMQRLAAASGIGFFALIILTFLFSGDDTPDWAAPASEYVQFNRDNADDVQLGSLFFLLASLELLWFAGYLRSELGRFESLARGFTRVSHIAFGGGVVAAVGLALTALMSVVAVSQPDDTTGEVVRALHHISFATWTIAAVGLAVMLTAASLLALRTAVLPSWLGWVGLVTGLCQFLLLFIVLKPEDDEFWIGFAWLPGFLGLMIWIVGASLVFMRRVGKPDPV
jgi:hypothetical protein